jgi:hypothetical protein
LNFIDFASIDFVAMPHAVVMVAAIPDAAGAKLMMLCKRWVIWALMLFG